MTLQKIGNVVMSRRRTMTEVIDIGNLCVHCRKDTSFGSGRFVNRYPVFGLENIDTGQEEDGYCCDKCEQQWYRDNPIGERG